MKVLAIVLALALPSVALAEGGGKRGDGGNENVVNLSSDTEGGNMWILPDVPDGPGGTYAIANSICGQSSPNEDQKDLCDMAMDDVDATRAPWVCRVFLNEIPLIRWLCR